jgi:DNA-binding SARP family transcriptional activator/TolB-like protein
MIRLRTLGALDLRDADGQELRGVLAQPKRAALLAYLALATPRGYHRRDTLLALFWPEHDEEHARNALSQAVHFLRRSLGSEAVVGSNGAGIGIDRSLLWCDGVAFEEALDGGRTAEAVELYRGDLLEGFHITAAPDFERWVEGERTRLAGRYVRALETCALERESAGDYDGAVTWWRRLAARDLYSSRVALRLMRALAAAGNPEGAVQHARLHQTLVREELNVAPDPQIADFVRQLETSEGSSNRPTPPIEPRSASGDALVATTPLASRTTGHHRRPALLATGLVFLLAAAAGAVVLRNGPDSAEHAAIRSIGVLPFESFSGDSAHQAFADGMHDALIAELARYPDLTVISRTSMMRFRATEKPLPEIAQELGVDGLIEGTLSWERGQFRMNAQLVHASDRHLWSKSYRRDLRDMLSLQGELSEAIAREVRIASSPRLRPRQSARGPADSVPGELYLRELYLRGRHAEISRSLTGVLTAKEAYRRAIQRDSTFAPAYAGLAAVYGFLAEYRYAPVEASLDSARLMARRAVELDSLLPEAHVALAVTLVAAWQFAAAEREFQRALELGPSNARAHYWYSMLLVALGRGEEALREANRTLELDPFAPRGAFGMQRYATYLLTGKRPDRDLPVAQRHPILKLEPGEPWARAWEAIDLAEAGRCADARAALAVGRRGVPPDNIRMLPYVGIVDWECGERARARALLAEMKRRPDAHENGWRMAWLHTRFGEKDSAFVWLDRQRWTLGEMSGLSADRALDPVRSDPRYGALLRRLGLREEDQKLPST